MLLAGSHLAPEKSVSLGRWGLRNDDGFIYHWIYNPEGLCCWGACLAGCEVSERVLSGTDLGLNPVFITYWLWLWPNFLTSLNLRFIMCKIPNVRECCQWKILSIVDTQGLWVHSVSSFSYPLENLPVTDLPCSSHLTLAIISNIASVMKLSCFPFLNLMPGSTSFFVMVSHFLRIVTIGIIVPITLYYRYLFMHLFPSGL